MDTTYDDQTLAGVFEHLSFAGKVKPYDKFGPAEETATASSTLLGF